MGGAACRHKDGKNRWQPCLHTGHHSSLNTRPGITKVCKDPPNSLREGGEKTGRFSEEASAPQRPGLSHSLGQKERDSGWAELRRRAARVLYNWRKQHVHFIPLFSIIYLKTVSLCRGYMLQSLSCFGFGSSTDRAPDPGDISCLPLPCLTTLG